MEKKNLIIKILVPALIIATIGIMWVIKNNQREDKLSNSNNQEHISVEIPEHLKDADFSLDITEAVDFKSFSQYNLPAIIDFGADYCGPCRQMAPIYKNVNQKMQGKAFIKYVDTEKHPEACADVPIQVIPTQLFINADGTPFVPSDELSKMIEFTMYSRKDTNEHVYTVHQGILTEGQLDKILKEMGVE